MNRTVVAVDRDLGPYQDALREAGYHVVPADAAHLREAAAIVVDGIDDRVMGIETPLSPAPVINATGRTAEEVVEEVRRRAWK
jgi:Na+/H+-translocating membrane pyrophosphatase